MIDIERLLSIPKEDILRESRGIISDEIKDLVELLSVKDNKIRYQSLLLLQSRSMYYNDVYPYWETFYQKLKSQNSYQVNIGLMLISENVKWDKENKFNSIIHDYLLHLENEKPITIRICIQSLKNIIPFYKQLHFLISNKLMDINILCIRETMKKLILIDILEVLIIIREFHTTDEIESYIFNALDSELLDKKTIKLLNFMLKNAVY